VIARSLNAFYEPIPGSSTHLDPRTITDFNKSFFGFYEIKNTAQVANGKRSIFNCQARHNMACSGGRRAAFGHASHRKENRAVEGLFWRTFS
jgi:hypothetical protein